MSIGVSVRATKFAGRNAGYLGYIGTINPQVDMVAKIGSKCRQLDSFKLFDR